MLSPSIDELSTGNSTSASATALTMNARYVSFRPARSYSAFFASRIFAYAREVHLEHRVHVGGGAPAEHHVLGDLLAHHAHRHDLDGLARFERRHVADHRQARRWTVLEEAEDVVLGDAAADAGAVQAGDVDVVFPGDAPHERRRSRPARVAGDWLGIAVAAGDDRRGRRFGLAAGLAAGCDTAAGAETTTLSPIVATTLFTGTVSPSRTLISARMPATGEGDLGVHLVGGDLEEGLVAAHRLADFLDPADDGALGDRFAHLGHQDRCGHMWIAAPCVACAASPTASDIVGCA
jgi:hypothetical protein